MSTNPRTDVKFRQPDCLFIGGQWVTPSSKALLDVDDSATEEVWLQVPDGDAEDMARAAAAARKAFDEGPWPRMTPQERAEYMRAIAAGLRERGADLAQIWPRETGSLFSEAQGIGERAARNFEKYAEMADTHEWETRVTPNRGGKMALVVHEPVGPTAAIITWNSPLGGISHKTGPALLAGCPVVVKLSPEAPGEGYVFAEVCDDVGLPPGVVNVVAAEREVSELLVRDPRIEKVSFTGSTAAGKKIMSACGERIARCTLELGGKSAAIVLDDMDIDEVGTYLGELELRMSGQVCSSLTRIIVGRDRHDQMVDVLAKVFAKVKIGDPFDATTEMGPVATRRQMDRINGYIEKGLAGGATLSYGGGRPEGFPKGWFVEPTIFSNVDNDSVLAQEEIFGPVLSVIPANSEQHAIDMANGTPYGLNTSVFTKDVSHARDVARQIRSGTVGHNAWRNDFDIAVGGFKQSGIGRQGFMTGLEEFLEMKTIILDDVLPEYAD